MFTRQKLVEEALFLPVEDRAFIIDSLIKSMNPINPDIEQEWIKISEKRLDELKSGKVKGIPGDEVFNKIWK